MSNPWIPPPENTYKINFHCLMTCKQQNGNSNGIGIIIRDHQGRLVKGLCGTIPNLPNLATQLWALHMGVVHAKRMGLRSVTVETDNFTPYHEMARKDGGGDGSVAWIVEQIKKLLGVSSWSKKIHLVEGNVNKTALYLATIGLQQWSSMHEFYTPFGKLQERMDLDMGFGPHIYQLRVTPIPRNIKGEVIGFEQEHAGQDFPTAEGGACQGRGNGVGQGASRPSK